MVYEMTEAKQYLENIERLEPDISTVWGESISSESSQATALISAAISLKRIADAMPCADFPETMVITIAERNPFNALPGTHVLTRGSGEGVYYVGVGIKAVINA